jgi:hypothetical protein
MPRGPKTRSAPPASQRDPVLPLVDPRRVIDAAVLPCHSPRFIPAFLLYPTPLVA